MRAFFPYILVTVGMRTVPASILPPMIIEVMLAEAMAVDSVTTDIMPMAMEEPMARNQGISSVTGLAGGASIWNFAVSISRLKRGER